MTKMTVTVKVMMVNVILIHHLRLLLKSHHHLALLHGLNYFPSYSLVRMLAVT
jgi:hypothetical protein